MGSKRDWRALLVGAHHAQKIGSVTRRPRPLPEKYCVMTVCAKAAGLVDHELLVTEIAAAAQSSVQVYERITRFSSMSLR